MTGSRVALVGASTVVVATVVLFLRGFVAALFVPFAAARVLRRG